MTEPNQPTEPTTAKEDSASSAGPVVESSAVVPSKPKGWWSGLRRFALLALYIGFLTAVVLAALAALEYYAKLKVKESPLGQAYKGRDLDLARQSSQTVAPLFGYEPTPGFVAVRNTRLGNSYEYINEDSFKEFEEVPREKPEDEYRVIVTGGSVVYGRGPVPPSDAICDFYEVTFRWNIPHIMEMLLNADPEVKAKVNGKKIRVINAGVAGFVYQNNLMRYLAKLRLYQPDLVVALDGANEVHTVARPLKDWNYFTEGPYYQRVVEVMDMSGKGLMNYLTLWLKRNTYFFTWLAMKKGEGPGILIEDSGFAAHPQDATPEMIEYRNRNVDQVADVAVIYHKTLEADRVPHVFALQPMFRNSKKKRTPIEEKIEQVTGMQKIGFYDAAETYQVLVDRVKKRCSEANFEVVDLVGFYDKVTDWVFTDWCHLTNGANFLIAKELTNQVKTRIFGLPLGPHDKIHNPSDGYFRDYAKESIVLVDNQRTDEGQRILKGYPGPELLELTAENPSVVLDIGSVSPLSRVRIVWGDEKSVPSQWRLETSEDGKTWKDWITVAKTKTDAYDQWPGYEHYAADETPARYVRYSPEPGSGPIRLRQLSVFR